MWFYYYTYCLFKSILLNMHLCIYDKLNLFLLLITVLLLRIILEGYPFWHNAINPSIKTTQIWLHVMGGLTQWNGKPLNFFILSRWLKHTAKMRSHRYLRLSFGCQLVFGAWLMTLLFSWEVELKGGNLHHRDMGPFLFCFVFFRITSILQDGFSYLFQPFKLYQSAITFSHYHSPSRGQASLFPIC